MWLSNEKLREIKSDIKRAIMEELGTVEVPVYYRNGSRVLDYDRYEHGRVEKVSPALAIQQLVDSTKLRKIIPNTEDTVTEIAIPECKNFKEVK